MPGSEAQPTPPMTFNPTGDDDAPPSSVPTGDNAADEDGFSTIVPSTSNEQAPLDKIKYNIKLLMPIRQDNSNNN
jgi:hypothetical protein